MTFVLIACRGSNRALARSLAAMLATKHIEVCAGLEQAPADICADAYRAAIDRGALMVALWAEDDHTDAAYVDQMLYAQRSGRLFAVAVGSARLPGNLGGDDSVASALDDRDAQQRETLSDLIAQRVFALSEQSDLDARPPGSAAEETKAFLRVQRQRSANALVRFLREYPDGIFENVVRDQLDAETRPQYQPDQRPDGKWLSTLAQRLSFRRADAVSGSSQDDPSATEVWRMDASPWTAARGMGSALVQRARSPAGVAIAGTMLIAVLGFAGWRWVQWPHSRPTPATVTLAPRDAYAGAQARGRASAPMTGSTTTPAPVVGVGRPVVGSVDALRGSTVESRAPAMAQAAEISPSVQTPAIETQPTANGPATEQTADDPGPRQSENRVESDARAIQLARRQDTVAGYNAYLAAFPAGAFAGEARSARDHLLQGPPAFDLAQLDPDARSLVQRARQSEASANAEAARRSGAISVTRPGSGAGSYRGAASGGVANGLGKAVWNNGDAYAGAWTGSLPNGFGVLRLANGSRYEGQFAAGAPTGRGVFWNEEGRRLMGDRLFAALVRARSQ